MDDESSDDDTGSDDEEVSGRAVPVARGSAEEASGDKTKGKLIYNDILHTTLLIHSFFC